MLFWEADSVEEVVGVIPLDVCLEVSFLCEGVLTILTDKRSLSGVFLHVNLKMENKWQVCLENGSTKCIISWNL